MVEIKEKPEKHDQFEEKLVEIKFDQKLYDIHSQLQDQLDCVKELKREMGHRMETFAKKVTDTIEVFA